MRVNYIAIAMGALLLLGNSQAAKISDIANTKHNLSMTWGGEGVDPRSVTATSESQICVFCHTPHGANTATAPLWNRSLEGDAGYSATYSMYNSSSMEASQLAGSPPTAPSNSSKLCLSCHDGVIAVGAVNVLNGSPTTIAMNNTGSGGVMPDGSYGANSGNTRNIGTNLTNDHPISITYNSTLALADGELTDPFASPHVGVRGPGVRPLIPLIPDPQDGGAPKLECVSCHDPHIRDNTGTDIKFLRLNRFQANNDPVGQGGNANLVNFNENNDIICLACHNKEGWVDSAHASEQVANETYNAAAASARDFPVNIQVWQAACLNCHDTHTVAGSRRLLREGTNDIPPNGQVIKAGGGSPAIEETCYQCHANSADPYYVLDGSNPEVPDIKSDFQLARHMPITSAEQPANAEVHDIGNTGTNGDGKEMIESPLTLGKGNLMNRHAECTDCHNPHRVTKNRLATDAPSTPAAAGTHDHNLIDGATQHTNLISGVLRGTWGVEPVYSSTAFSTIPTSYTIKKGVPPQNGSTAVTSSYVTREYQVCLKCHSDYGFDDINPPALGYYAGGTPSGTNGVTHYTNQAMEFQAPVSHQGEGTALNSGSAVGDYACTFPTNMAGPLERTCNVENNNHRSWHPVMGPTGRTAAVRNMDSANFLPPFNDATGTNIGNQTMYCSDCHGSDTENATSEPTGGENGNPWGPHGSNNDFILKGPWGVDTGDMHPDHLCFKCHDYDDYAWRNNPAPGLSGFRTAPGYTEIAGCTLGWKDTNLHIAHAQKISLTRFRCKWCHVAVPHGWKNKALLVNLNDIGPEVGLPAGTVVDSPYNQGPYYLDSMLRIVNFAQSGNWTAVDCGGGGGVQGWMAGSCNQPP